MNIIIKKPELEKKRINSNLPIAPRSPIDKTNNQILEKYKISLSNKSQIPKPTINTYKGPSIIPKAHFKGKNANFFNYTMDSKTINENRKPNYYRSNTFSKNNSNYMKLNKPYLNLNTTNDKKCCCCGCICWLFFDLDDSPMKPHNNTPKRFISDNRRFKSDLRNISDESDDRVNNHQRNLTTNKKTFNQINNSIMSIRRRNENHDDDDKEKEKEKQKNRTMVKNDNINRKIHLTIPCKIIDLRNLKKDKGVKSEKNENNVKNGINYENNGFKNGKNENNLMNGKNGKNEKYENNGVKNGKNEKYENNVRNGKNENEKYIVGNEKNEKYENNIRNGKNEKNENNENNLMVGRNEKHEKNEHNVKNGKNENNDRNGKNEKNENNVINRRIGKYEKYENNIRNGKNEKNENNVINGRIGKYENNARNGKNKNNENNMINGRNVKNEKYENNIRNGKNENNVMDRRNEKYEKYENNDVRNGKKEKKENNLKKIKPEIIIENNESNKKIEKNEKTPSNSNNQIKINFDKYKKLFKKKKKKVDLLTINDLASVKERIESFLHGPSYLKDKRECELCHKKVLNYSYQFHFRSHPTKILNWMFCGTFNNAINNEEIKDLDIKYVLNCASEIKPKNLPKYVKYCQLNILDDNTTDITRYFNKGFSFIEEARQNKQNILIHCKLGISRSPAIIIGYFIKYMGYTTEDALHFLTSKRSQIYPNSGFIEQLKNYEKQNKKTQRSRMISNISHSAADIIYK